MLQFYHCHIMAAVSRALCTMQRVLYNARHAPMPITRSVDNTSVVALDSATQTKYFEYKDSRTRRVAMYDDAQVGVARQQTLL